ncbi:glycoside hydrolase [Pilatotrama ljubarskyi]|nr:glycoside hydrolase [Pilatotrama ljubarskyi]
MVSSGGFVSLLHSLGLVQGLFKPVPNQYAVTSQPTEAKLAFPSSTDASPGKNAQLLASANFPGIADQLNRVSVDCTVQPYDAPDLGAPSFPPYDSAKANVYRYRQQQSVNLGSWFVHERWMTPSLFLCATGDQASELDIASGWGSLDSARSLLERHWDTFINASDFQYLSGIGINTVRLPVGYWNLGPAFCQGTPFEAVASVYQNSWVRVIRAINMASDAGLGVLVDLHGAPGSQNGQPHSGISDGDANLFDDDWYINKTITVLTYLTEQLADVSNVVGIQLLNEPKNVESLPDFYTQAISAMRQVNTAAKNLALYVHDGFDLDQYSDFVANRSDFVVLDHHSYFVFTSADETEPASQHTKDVQGPIAASLAAASARQRRNLVVDEFSCALTYQSLAGEPHTDQARKEFCQGQMEIYHNETAGWAFWAYNKEDCFDDPGWCFKAAVGRSLPSSFFSYGKGPVADPSHLPALADMAADMCSSPEDIVAMHPNVTDRSSDPALFFDVSFLPVDRRNHHRPSRRSGAMHQQAVWKNRRDTTHQLPLDPSQRAISKGYSDGFLTAKVFALYGMSKLGFTGQYISDSIAKLGPEVVAPGTEQYYEDWFLEGLADGEALISASVDSSSAT